MRPIKPMIVIAALATPLAVSAADGISIDPGMWEYTTTMTLSMMPQPIVKSRQECFTESHFDAQALSKDSDCTVQDYQVDGNTMTFTMVCPGPEGPTVGQGRYTSAGSSGTGEMAMTMTVNGAPHSMKMNWQGKRIGAC